jgi:uncharacterized membrane protein
MSGPILLPVMVLAGACVVWVLRRSRLTTRTQLIVLAACGAAGVILLVIVDG